MIANIIVNVETDQVNNLYDYIVPEKFKNIIKVGARVIVNFKNRYLLGFVMKLSDKSEFANKEIQELIDIYPVLTSEMIEIASYFSKKNKNLICSFIKAILPNVLNIKVKKSFKVLNEDNLNPILKEKVKNGYLNLEQTFLPLIKEEIDKNNLEESYSYKLEKPKMEIIYTLTDKLFEKGNQNQEKIIDYLNKNSFISRTELLNNYSPSSLKTLEKNGYIKKIYQENYRDILSLYKEKNKTITLTQEQESAINKIDLSTNNKYLLHGVTNSGKTEVYLNLIEKVLKNNKTAILLVPEISLTPMIIYRVKNRFADLVAVYHSGLSNEERFDEYRRIQKKEAKVVIGTRSAIFMPLLNLGIIIFDEEHDESYIQYDNPKYDAKEIAEYRSKIHNCPIIYGSATPKISSYYKALSKEYQLIEMKSRINKLHTNVKLVDMREEFKNDNRSIFSKELQEKIQDRLNKKEQILILLNKKGFNQFVMCRECGHVLKCEHCDVSYTYYKSDNTLRCNYCGSKIKNVSVCPKCNSPYIRYVGTGTEKVFSELEKLFNARIVRMDRDTTSKKLSHEKILSDFNDQKYDILLGTQMISKGLDFPNVTLVGILMADYSLSYPEYLAKEKTFDLIFQMIGRSGRDEKKGEVIIQSYNCNNYAIVSAKNQDYLSFYKDEIVYREIGKFPPFYDFYEILVTSTNENLALLQAMKIKEEFKKLYPKEEIKGPNNNYIEMIKDKHIINLMIKTKKDITEFLFSLKSNKNVLISITKK